MAEKKNSAYWQKRFEELEASQHKQSVEAMKNIEEAFEQSQMQIERQIEVWYSRYATNNGINLVEARKQLNASELKELNWDIKEYIKYGRENAVTKQWMTELENASAKFHISRLDALRLRTRQAMETAFGNEQNVTDKMIRSLYQSSYYHTCYEVQKGFQIGWDVGQIDNRKLSKVINNPWAADGKTFSDRIWSRKDAMTNQLHQEMVRTIIQGKGPDEAIKHMSKFVSDKVKNARSAAGTLVMTESAFISSAAQKEAFQDLGVEEYEIVATLDSHTSDICQTMDGQHFPMRVFEPGVTAPPFHPRCRSCTCPYFNDEFEYGERTARGEDGKTYYVSNDMTYKEWKRNFAKNVEINNEFVETKLLSPDIKENIIDTVEKLKRKYGYEIEMIEFAPFEKVKAPLSYIAYNENGMYKAKLNVNTLFDWNENLESLNERIYNRNYRKGLLASKTLEDLIYHEYAHFLTFADCKTFTDFRIKERSIGKRHIIGVSTYADASLDGAETIAEAFVRKKNGENLTEEVLALLNAIIGGIG